jgi:hypothetical protein
MAQFFSNFCRFSLFYQLYDKKYAMLLNYDSAIYNLHYSVSLCVYRLCKQENDLQTLEIRNMKEKNVPTIKMQYNN